VHHASIVERGGQVELRVTGSSGRMARTTLAGSLVTAAQALRDGLASERVKRLGVDGLPVAVGYTLGRWAPSHPWLCGDAATVVRLEEGVLSLALPGASPLTMALPEAVEDAAPLLAGASRAWPEPAPALMPAVSDPGIAAGVVLGLAFGGQDPELLDTVATARKREERGEMPAHTREAIRPLWLDLVRLIRYGLPTDRLLGEVRALPVARTHPKAFEAWLAEAQRRGRKEQRALDEVLAIAQRLGPDAREVRLTIQQTVERMGWTAFAHIANGKLDWMRSQRRLRQAQQAPEPPRSSVRAGSLDHRVQALAPASGWTLLIDESGDGAKKAFDQSRAALAAGHAPRVVGVLVPDGADLPDLPRGFHARNVPDPDTLDTHMQDMLDAPVGVLGLCASALPVSHGNLWFQGVMELVRWSARLLPLAGDTVLRVRIEQRGDYKPTSDLQATADELMRQLAEVDPGRAAMLRIELRVVAKDASPHLGYADLVAFCWGQRAPHTHAMMAQSGLLGTCLLAGDASQLRKAWEAIDGGRRPDAAGWQRLMEDPDARVPGSLVRLLLDRVAAACREDAGYWRSLCEGVLARLDGRDVNLVVVGDAVAELARCTPSGEALTPRMQLAFQTARLWHANHLGAVQLTLAHELFILGVRLFEEVPALVCQADLVRAVAHTNHFDFAGARVAVAHWRGMRPEVAGLQHHGRILSTLGQHAAFRGSQAEALHMFDEAMEAFSRLSEPRMAERERWQTGTYRAIAVMDTPGVPAEVVRAALEAQTGPLDAGSIGRWATDARNPFIHHALLRWLIAHGTPAERDAYREAGGIWETQAFHPWHLIEAYRGLLCWDAGDDAQAEAFLDSAVAIALAPGQGPTVRFMGLTLARLTTRLGLQREPIPDAELRALSEALPLAPWAAWGEEGALPSLAAAWAWLGRVLPFNFR
jgi:tellurite resistance protein